MDPEKREDGASASVQLVKKATYAELAAENEDLKKRIAELEAQLGQVESQEEVKTEEKAES